MAGRASRVAATAVLLCASTLPAACTVQQVSAKPEAGSVVRPAPGQPASSVLDLSAGTLPEPRAAEAAGPVPGVVPVRDAGVDPAQHAAQVAHPIHVSVPAVEVALPVQPSGLRDDGQMQVPPHAGTAGWYRLGVAPGARTGTAVIAAHVDSVASAGLGPFSRLGDVAVGDEVVVTADDGVVHRYAVTDVLALPKTEVRWSEVFTDDGRHRLALVTCGGTWRDDVRSYSDNVLVLALPVGESRS